MLRGVHGIFAHHGFLWAVLIIGGVVLVMVGILMALGIVSPLAAALTFSGITGTGAVLAVLAVSFLNQRALPANERLMGSLATVVEPLSPAGRVLVQGENWAAVLDELFADQPLPVGQTVRVLAVVDLRLVVAPESVPTLIAPTDVSAFS
jgi:membrane-bound ClpP family serine protease